MKYPKFTKCIRRFFGSRGRTLDAVLVCSLAVALLGGCSAATRLQSTYGNKYRYSYSMVAPARSDSLLFRDERLIIQFRFDDAAVGLQIQNISPFDLRVLWTGASLGIGGLYSGVRTLGNFYDTTLAAQHVPLIPPLGVSRDVLIPVNNVYIEGDRWREMDLFPTMDFNSPSLRDSILALVNTKVDIVLPMEFGGEEKTYRFMFAVDSVRSISWSEDRFPAWFPRGPGTPRINPSINDQLTAAILVAGFLGFSAYMLTAKKNPPTE